MRKLESRMNEQEKYDVIKELVERNGNKERVERNGNKERVAMKLDITKRQVDRLIIKYKETGKSGFVHGN